MWDKKGVIMQESKARPEQSFLKQDLFKGKLEKGQFQIDYLPMWRFLDSQDRKVPGGLKSLELKRVFEGIYEFAIIQVSLDKAEMQTRIDNLNEQNLKWFTKADQLEGELNLLKNKLQELQAEEVQPEPTEITPFEVISLSQDTKENS